MAELAASLATWRTRTSQVLREALDDAMFLKLLAISLIQNFKASLGRRVDHAGRGAFKSLTSGVICSFTAAITRRQT
jgi:hypothetical protein